MSVVYLLIPAVVLLALLIVVIFTGPAKMVAVFAIALAALIAFGCFSKINIEKSSPTSEERMNVVHVLDDYRSALITNSDNDIIRVRIQIQPDEHKEGIYKQNKRFFIFSEDAYVLFVSKSH